MTENKKRRVDEEVSAEKPEIRYAVRVCYDGPYECAMLSAPIDHPSVQRVKAALRTLVSFDRQVEGPMFSQFLVCKLVDVFQQRKVEPVTLALMRSIYSRATKDVVGTFDPIDPHTLITKEDRHVWRQPEDVIDTPDEPTVLYQLAVIECAE